MSAFEIKQGQTLVLDGQYLEDDGVTPKSLAGVTLQSQVRDKADNVVADAVIDVLDEAQGQYRMTFPGGTLAWPAGLLYCDLKQTIDHVSWLTETFVFTVKKAQTR